MYQQLAELESKSVGAPLVCVSSNAFTPDVYLEREPSIWEPDDLDSNEASCIDQDAPDSQPQPSAPPPNSPGQAEVAAISERPSAYEEAALTAASAEEIPGTFPEDHPARDGQGPTPAPTPTRLLPTRSSGWELL